MRAYTMVAALALIAAGSPAMAGNLDNLDTPYPTRGACENSVTRANGEVREGLLDTFPQFFNRMGDVASFLTRAFTCDYDSVVDAWFIRDHRGEVLFSDWYQRKP